ncbi:MAG: hypothetical protein QM770_11285 [Tepidisphaeraceae bacterium]
MASHDYIPMREADLALFTANFAAKLTANAVAVGCTAGQASAFSALNATWQNALAVSTAPATRTKDTITAKDLAKKNCVANLRQLARIIQAYPGTTDVLRDQFGLTVHSPRTPLPVPSQRPNVEVVNRAGTNIVIRLSDNAGKRTKPAGVQGARVYTFIGATPSTNPEDWRDEGQATRADIKLEFPPETPIGTTIYITAAWYNPRGQLGAACEPVKTFIAGGAMNMAA